MHRASINMGSHTSTHRTLRQWLKCASHSPRTMPFNSSILAAQAQCSPRSFSTWKSLHHLQRTRPRPSGLTQTFCTRPYSNTPQKSNDENRHTGAPSPISSNVVYQGPLARTFRSLKLFSLSSLGLATALTPFMFVIDTSLPNIARITLASTAMLTSGVSTALVGWCGHPYVATIRTRAPPPTSDHGAEPEKAAEQVEDIQLETLTLTLRPRFTTIYDTTFLIETKRPFAKWEIAENIVLQKSSEGVAAAGLPDEETIAETMDAQGRVVGRWIVSWSEDGLKGSCRGEGKVQRYAESSSSKAPTD